MKSFLEQYKKPILFGMMGMILLLGIVIGGILLFQQFKTYSYAEIEDQMVSGAKTYLKSHTEEYPTAGKPFLSISTDTLVQEKIMKDLTKLRKENCIGEVTVSYMEEDYRFTPTLTCDKYKTVTLKDYILNHNEIETENEGLYLLNENYTYRGEYIDNYITFAGFSWRIVKFNDEMFTLVLSDTVNNKGTVYVYDDRYNESVGSNRGRNSFQNSRMEESLKQIYEQDFKNYHSYLLETDVCIGRRMEDETDFTGEIECFDTTPSHISLLPVYDFLNASLDDKCTNTTSKNCSNYNYLSNTKNRYWLLNGTDADSYHVYFADTSGKIALDYASAKKDIRPVIYLPAEVIYKTGNGTADSPYEIMTY